MCVFLLLFYPGNVIVVTSGEIPLCGSWYLQDDGTTPLYVASERGQDAVVAALFGVRGSGKPGEDGRRGVLSIAGRFAVCRVHLRCCCFLGTWATFGVWCELVCLWVEAALLWVCVLSELIIGMLATSGESDVCQC